MKNNFKKESISGRCRIVQAIKNGNEDWGYDVVSIDDEEDKMFLWADEIRRVIK